jgi:putative polyhydroxyalkanoate system protein
MRIAVPHHTTKESAREKVERKLEDLVAQFGKHADEMQHAWAGDVLTFSGKAKGVKAGGTVEVNDQEVILDTKLPMIAKMFEPKIKAAIHKEAAVLFPKA